MQPRDWSRLCRNIYEKKCILFIGPEFPVQISEPGSNQPASTTLSKLISEKLVTLLSEHDRVPANVKRCLPHKEFTQLAGDFIKFTDTDKKTSRDDLEIIIRDYRRNELENRISSVELTEICSQLPFTLIVNTNCYDFISPILKESGKKPNTDFYNFRGHYKELVSSASSDILATEKYPFIYNLFGSAEKNTDSMVLSENELIEFVINLISRNPGLPKNIKSELSNTDRYFLFLGFGILAKNWYFRILLQALESNNKESMSYALECIDNIPDNEDPAIVFFREDLKLSLQHYDQATFIRDLVKNYAEYESKEQKFRTTSIAEDAPKAFISYKREDNERALEIYNKLLSRGIKVFLDTEKMKGEWKPTMLEEVSNADAFLLLHSKNLFSAGETEVYREIRTAWDKAQRFPSPADFILQGYLDSPEYILNKPCQLKDIHCYDLTKDENIELIAKEIKRAYERSRRKNAA